MDVDAKIYAAYIKPLCDKDHWESIKDKRALIKRKFWQIETCIADSRRFFNLLNSHERLNKAKLLFSTVYRIVSKFHRFHSVAPEYDATYTYFSMEFRDFLRFECVMDGIHAVNVIRDIKVWLDTCEKYQILNTLISICCKMATVLQNWFINVNINTLVIPCRVYVYTLYTKEIKKEIKHLCSSYFTARRISLLVV